MEMNGTRIKAKVFGGMELMIGGLVWPLKKEEEEDMHIWEMMEVVFQRFPIQNGNCIMDLGMLIEAKKSKSNVEVKYKFNTWHIDILIPKSSQSIGMIPVCVAGEGNL